MGSMLENASNDNAARELVKAFECCVQAGLPSDARFGDRERRALELGNELVRRHLEASLQAIADSESEGVVVNGVEYRRHQPGQAKYHSLCGALRVRRWTFRRWVCATEPRVCRWSCRRGWWREPLRCWPSR